MSIYMPDATCFKRIRERKFMKTHEAKLNANGNPAKKDVTNVQRKKNKNARLRTLYGEIYEDKPGYSWLAGKNGRKVSEDKYADILINRKIREFARADKKMNAVDEKIADAADILMDKYWYEWKEENVPDIHTVMTVPDIDI